MSVDLIERESITLIPENNILGRRPCSTVGDRI